MRVNLQGRIALVTGAAAGIGRAIALSLAENGAVVPVNDVNEKGNETCKEIEENGGRARYFAC